MSTLHSILCDNDPQEALIALETLPEYINTFDVRGYTPLILLSRRRYRSAHAARTFIDACVRAGADVNLHRGDNRTALYHAIEIRSVFAVDALLRHNSRLDLRVDGTYSLLHKAILVGVSVIVHLLCAAASPEVLKSRDRVTGDTFFHELIDRKALTPLLLQLADDGLLDSVMRTPNYAGETPMQRALRRRHEDALSIITAFTKSSH